MIEKYLVSPLLTLALVILALCWTVNGHAQLNTGKVEGTVRDQATGAPLAGAQATVEGTRLGNVTNADGYYFILNVPPGGRSVTFTYTGYQKTTISNLLILAGQTLTVDGNLSGTVVELGGITIEAEADPLLVRDETVTKRRLTSENIAETPASTLEDMLLYEPGVQTGGVEALGRGIRIRGGRLGEEAMVIDGITVRNYTADPFKSGQGWVYEQEEGSKSVDTTPLEFSTGSVEQVDIITGGFQAEYGNAQSGIVNIVTKEGGADWKGSVRYTTDQQNPRTSDYGYNQVMVSVGGPIPGIPNMYMHSSGEIQGTADKTPTHADEGFRGVNQDFVDRLNDAVRNDPYFGPKLPVFSLEEFKTGAEFYSGKTGKSAALWSPGNPVRIPGNWQDRTLAASKLSYYPVKGLKFIGTISFSRNQNSYAWGDDGNYFKNGYATMGQLPQRDWASDAPDTTVIIPQAYGRRTRTSNLLAGFNWDFLQTAQRSGTLQIRYSRFKVQDINNASLKDNYTRDNTFMSWTPHDIPFEIETFPRDENGNLYIPLDNSAEGKLFFPDGLSCWSREWDFETAFNLDRGDALYWLSYFYSREWQNNYKADADFQLDRRNRAKVGVAITAFDNYLYELRSSSWLRKVDVKNAFNYEPQMVSWYLQNRTDLGDFVFNYGLRYDSFDPKDNWGQRFGDQHGQHYFVNKITDWSPRFDVAFPVTDKSQLRFSYGVFTQLPSLSFIFSEGNHGDLEFSRTDAFEAGMTHLVTNDMVVDLVGYYKDVIGNVADKEYFLDYVPYQSGRLERYFTSGYTNRDNGNIKGMDVTLRKRFSDNFSYDLMYTLQFSRTTGSRYNTTAGFDLFLDAAVGETYRPPDEIRPIEGDVTHKFTIRFNYLFPEDFRVGSTANTILKNVRVYAIGNVSSGVPAFERTNRTWETMNAAEDLRWMTYRAGRPIGGVNYFRGRWFYSLNLRFTKAFMLGGTRRLSFFTEVFNAFNQKLPTVYPGGYTYEGYYASPMGGVDVPWSDDLTWQKKAWFQCDFNGDGVMSVEEAAKGNMARNMYRQTIDKTAYGTARQIRCGLDFTF